MKAVRIGGETRRTCPVERKAQGSIGPSSVATQSVATDSAMEQGPETGSRDGNGWLRQQGLWQDNGEGARTAVTRGGCR